MRRRRETLVVSNACGGMNPQFKPAIMLIEDHINILQSLIGVNDDSWSTIPDMRTVFEELIASAGAWRYKTQKGVYVTVAGPNGDAEYRFFRAISAGVVSMSTVQSRRRGPRGHEVLDSRLSPTWVADILEPANIERICKTPQKRNRR